MIKAIYTVVGVNANEHDTHCAVVVEYSVLASNANDRLHVHLPIGSENQMYAALAAALKTHLISIGIPMGPSDKAQRI